MWTTATVFATAVIALIAIAMFVSYFRLFYALRGKRVVTCPATHEAVGIDIDASLAARSTLLDDPKLRVVNCTRWPENAACEQGCLTQVQAHPEDTLMRNILAGWYLDKDCAICGRAIGEINWHDAIPALRDADGMYRDWAAVTPEQLKLLLETSVPICWNCYSAETFRASYPNLVTDRADTPLRNRLIH